MGEQIAPELPPELPRHVSANGAELWDWAAKLGGYVHRQARRRELAENIRNAQRQCGSCRMWMSKTCPKERDDGSGYSRGPSMNAPICGRFDMKSSTAELIDRWRAEAATLAQGHAA